MLKFNAKFRLLLEFLLWFLKNCKFLVKFKRNLLNFTLKFTDEIVKNLKGQQ